MVFHKKIEERMENRNQGQHYPTCRHCGEHPCVLQSIEDDLWGMGD